MAMGKRTQEQTPLWWRRSFAHLYDTGGMRRTHLRGHENILKRLLIHAGGFNRLTASDRKRFVAVIGTTEPGNLWIFGNRPRIDWRIGPSRMHMSLFIWDEVFYFSTFDAWTRNRAAVGGRKTLGNRLAVNIYYQRQDDAHSSPRHLNSIGALFELRIP